VQLRRLPEWVERRHANHVAWCAALSDVPELTVFPEAPGTFHAGFAFPMLVGAGARGGRPRLSATLEAVRIDTRPISGSNLARQPAFRHVAARTPVPLPVSDAVHERGVFIGNSHAFGPEHGQLLTRAIRAWSKE
jgi:CDP-6-deoxy-D-xylo-4-hexulose-3-dehydrase